VENPIASCNSASERPASLDDSSIRSSLKAAEYTFTGTVAISPTLVTPNCKDSAKPAAIARATSRLVRFRSAITKRSHSGRRTPGSPAGLPRSLNSRCACALTSPGAKATSPQSSIAKAAGFSAPTDYWLDHEEGFLTLHFTLPLARPFKPDGEVVLEVYDPEYFVAFELPSEEAVRMVGAPAGCKLRVQLARELDNAASAALAEVGPEQRELPEELKALTEGLDNSAAVLCS